MKHIALLISSIFIVIGSTFSQDQVHDKAILFTLSGLSNISVGDYAGGVGVRLQNGTSSFWTLDLGLQSVESKTDVSLGAGYFWQLSPLRTAGAYFGPSAFYNTVDKGWDVDGSLGWQWDAFHDLSLTASYCLAVHLPHEGESSVATVASGKLGLVCWF